ncbi:MAG: hypothetical protein AB7O78_17735 [Thermoleophilia bacterium]
MYLLIRDDGCPEVILATLDEQLRDRELIACRLREPNVGFTEDVVQIDDPGVIGQLRRDGA